MSRWWIVIALLLSLGVNAGLLVNRAWQRRGDTSTPVAEPAGDGGGQVPLFVRRMAGELGLRGEQREVFIDRQRLFLEQTLGARERFAELQGELRRQVVAPDPDRAAVEDLLGEIAEAHVDMERAFVDNLLDTRELLDREQEQLYMRMLQRLRQSREDLRHRFRDRLGPGPPGGERPRWRRPGGWQRPGRDRGGPGRPMRPAPPTEQPPPPAEESPASAPER